MGKIWNNGDFQPTNSFFAGKGGKFLVCLESDDESFSLAAGVGPVSREEPGKGKKMNACQFWLPESL